MHLSLITCVLDSHEVLRRQLLHINNLSMIDCELIVVDDGSKPSLEETFYSVFKTYPSTLFCTNDSRPWTHTRARNIGASLANGDKLLLFDIDHIVTEAVLSAALASNHDKMHWHRVYGVLDAYGEISTDNATLITYGMKSPKPRQKYHTDSYVIQRHLFELAGGYDENLCGKYGVADASFQDRYARLVHAGKAQNPVLSKSTGYVFPNPADNTKLFHNLPRKSYMGVN